MKEVVGDLWTYPADVRIITTNGTINSKGECVMGRGCAREAKERFTNLPKLLADRIKEEGNHPYEFWLPYTNTNWPTPAGDAELTSAAVGGWARPIITFPVKHQWFERADLTLIRTSALQLIRMLDPEKTYVMPRPGCGNGGREWREVRPLLTDLPDNVHVIDFPPAAISSQTPSQPSAA